MTNDQINQTIHEAQGLCWHRPLEGKSWVCICGHEGGLLLHMEVYNPDYTSDWSAYGNVLEWAQGKEWWEKYAVEGCLDIIEQPNHFEEACWAMVLRGLDILLNPLLGSTALAKFIVANPEHFEKKVEK